MLDAQELKVVLEAKLRGRLVPPQALLGRFRMLDEKSRLTGLYGDPSYAPLYYHLGRLAPARRLAEFGFGLGLASGCYMWGCGGVREFLGFQVAGPEFYHPRVGVANVKQVFRGRGHVHYGRLHDEDFCRRLRAGGWGVALVSDRAAYDGMTAVLSAAWDALADGGLVCVEHLTADRVVGRAFADFCKVKNRRPATLMTRNGTGLVVK